MTLAQSLQILVDYLQRDVSDSKATDFINFIIVDSKNGIYAGGIPFNLLDELGIQIIDTKLIHKGNKYYNDDRLVSALLSLT